MKGKRIVITGATNGIGLAAAVALAGEGGNVVVVGRNATRAKIAAAQIRSKVGSGATVETLIADLSLAEWSREATPRRSWHAFGRSSAVASWLYPLCDAGRPGQFRNSSPK
jgi:NAD(P)-dependent dehydrogenase (short-subunit alcohol dehydrogenase family)